MSGGPHFARRTTDGRVLRADRSRKQLADDVLDRVIVKGGNYQPKLRTLVQDVTGNHRTKVSRLFGRRRLLLTHIARTAADQVVDSLGLDPHTRASLSKRDVRAIAWAVLAGRRLERGA